MWQPTAEGPTLRVGRSGGSKPEDMGYTPCLLAFLSLVAAIFSVFSSQFAVGLYHRGCGGGGSLGHTMATLGGIRDSEGPLSNSAEVEELARFAVDEHNKKENALLEFARVVKAKEQVVAGTLHHLTLEVIEAGKKKLYEAKVWVKPWLASKELQEFKHVEEPTSATITAADLGAKRGDPEGGLRELPAQDPVIKDAANRAVEFMQQRSNSLVPYELLDILDAKTEVANELAKFHLLLKVKRGATEEKFRVEMHKNLEGAFLLNQMRQEHSTE